MNKEVPLKDRIEKLYESGYVNEFNYLENQLQEARYLVAILHKQIEEKDKEIERLSKEVDMWNRKYNEQIDIINELEKDVYNEIEIVKQCQLASFRTKSGIEQYKPELKAYYWILSRIKELKEGK